MDNDEAGQKAVLKFDEVFPDIHTSQSAYFQPYKDINKALMAGHVPIFAATKKKA